MQKLFTAFYSFYALIVFLVLMLLGVMVYCFEIIFRPQKTTETLYKYIQFWSGTWLKLTGIKLIIKGLENVAPNTSYVLVSNHTSSADIFPMAYGLKIPYRPLGKEELKTMPFMGLFFSKTLVFVDRKDNESRKKSMLLMKEIIKQNISILIFPEGTRNTTQKPLKEFYDGAFRLAIETGVPILPLVICNASTAWPLNSFSLKKIDLKLCYLPPIATAQLQEQDIEALKQKTYLAMEKIILQEDIKFENKKI